LGYVYRFFTFISLLFRKALFPNVLGGSLVRLAVDSYLTRLRDLRELIFVPSIAREDDAAVAVSLPVLGAYRL
jgi:hypothetical protein